jgi:hypothetical protein
MNSPRSLKRQRTEQAEEITPIPRWGASLSIWNEDTVILYGGESDEGYGRALGTTHTYNIQKSKWSITTESLATARVWHSSTRIPRLNALFIFGGESYNSSATPEILGNSMIFDMQQGIYYPPVTSGKGPKKRSGHSACLVNDDIIIFGGIARRSWLDDMYALNTKTWQWRLIECVTKATSSSSSSSSSKPSSLASPSSTSSSSSSSSTTGLSTAWSLQHSGHCMDPAPLPEACSYSTFTSLQDGRALLFGGNNGSQSFNCCNILDTTRGPWRWVIPTTLGQAPCPRTGHAATRVTRSNGHSAVLIHGGWDPQSSGGGGSDSNMSHLITFSDCFLIDVETMVWSTICFSDGIQETLALVGHSMCFLEKNRNIIIYGGQGQVPESLRHSDVHVLDYDLQVDKPKGREGQATKAPTPLLSSISPSVPISKFPSTITN